MSRWAKRQHWDGQFWRQATEPVTVIDTMVPEIRSLPDSFAAGLRG